MAWSLKQLQSYMKSPQGKKLIAQAKRLDTPQNREKAKELVTELRKRAEPVAKEVAKQAVPKAKAAAAKVTERKKPQGGAATPPA